MLGKWVSRIMIVKMRQHLVSGYKHKNKFDWEKTDSLKIKYVCVYLYFSVVSKGASE